MPMKIRFLIKESVQNDARGSGEYKLESLYQTEMRRIATCL